MIETTLLSLDGLAIGRSVDPAWRTHNLGALLFRATDRCVRTKIRAVHAGGFPTISDAQLTLFHHLAPGGMRLTALAAQANLTKQSMIELVDRAGGLGLVERCHDPDDRRAKVVRPTAHAERLLISLRTGVVEAEREVQEVFGAVFLREARDRLESYASQEPRSLFAVPEGDAWRLHNIGRIFAMAARQFSREALAVACDRGWTSVNEVSLALFRNLALDGSRLTDIAAAARVTKQSMRELVDRAETLGLVRRYPDPADGRAKLVAFTFAGLTMLDDVHEGLAIAERQFCELTSAVFATTLKARLHDYVNASGQPVPLRPDLC